MICCLFTKREKCRVSNTDGFWTYLFTEHTLNAMNSTKWKHSPFYLSIVATMTDKISKKNVAHPHELLANGFIRISNCKNALFICGTCQRYFSGRWIHRFVLPLDWFLCVGYVKQFLPVFHHHLWLTSNKEKKNSIIAFVHHWSIQICYNFIFLI